MSANAFEVHITKLHVDDSLLIAGNHETRPHIDPSRWRPLIMSLCRFFDIGREVHPSRLAQSDFMKVVISGANESLRTHRINSPSTRIVEHRIDK